MYLSIGRWCHRHRRIVVGFWLVLIVGVLSASSVVGSDFGGEPEAPESEAATGLEILQAHFEGAGAFQSGTIVFQADGGIDDPVVMAEMQELFAFTEGLPGVNVVSPYEPAGAFQVARQGPLAGEVAFARVELDESIGFGEGGSIGESILEEAPDLAGLRIELGGEALAGFEPPESELIGLAFAVVVLIVSFGSVLAMGLPIAVALSGVSVGIGVTSLLSNVTLMPDFATTIGAMIGLGVGIDYALFIVTRYRENLHLGDDVEAATAAAMDTAGRAVVFAGVTVVASLLGLLLIGLEFIAGLGIGASVTVLFTMLASTTLLPALLGFAGLKVEVTRWRGLVAAGLVAVALLGIGLGVPALVLGVPAAVVVVIVGSFLPVLKREVPRRQPKPIRETGWHRWSRLIQRRPWRFAIGGVLLLGAISLPVLGIRLGFSDEGNYPEETTTRQAYDLLADAFGPGFNGPFFAVTEIDGPGDLAVLDQVRTAVAADPGVAFVSPVVPSGPDPQAALLQIIPTTSPQDQATEDLINRLRSDVIPPAAGGTVDVVVTGFVAGSVDFSSYLGERSLVFFAVVLVVSFVLLMAVFRSLLVPLKAVIMNMLSISGAYGIVVAVFQWGWTSDITGIEPAPIEPFVPMMMFAIVFGLSMDYEVFLLSRIKEEYVRTDDAFNSVADGLASTARVISAAAAIMCVVFFSFLLEDNRITKLFGTGLGLAVLLDATLVRMLLVPATMELLGRRNWWIPRWLDRILPELNVEGTPRHTQAETIVAATEPVDEPADAPVGADLAVHAGAAAGPVVPERARVTPADLTRAAGAVADVVRDGGPLVSPEAPAEEAPVAVAVLDEAAPGPAAVDAVAPTVAGSADPDVVPGGVAEGSSTNGVGGDGHAADPSAPDRLATGWVIRTRRRD